MLWFGKKKKKPDQPLEADAKLTPDSPFFDLIEFAYEAFKTPVPDDLDACTECCITPEIEQSIRMRDISDLPLQHLRDWMGAAKPHAGVGLEIWRYLLPRVLETIAYGEEPKVTGYELSLSIHDTGNEALWSSEQWSVLDQFQRQYLRHIVESTEVSSVPELDEILCMFANGGWPLESLIEQILTMKHERLVERLWIDWCREVYEPGSISTTCFWEVRDKSTIDAFHRSPELKGAIGSVAQSAQADDDMKRKASTILETLESTNLGD